MIETKLPQIQFYCVFVQKYITGDVKMWKEQKTGTQGAAKCFTYVLTLFDNFCDLFRYRPMATWNLFGLIS